MSVPATMSALTPLFLTEALRRAEVTQSDVTDVRVERIAVGEGFLGELARLHLAYDGHGPSTVIAKIPTTDSDLKPLGVLLQAYERESRAFAEVTPQLRVRTPQCFYNGRDVATDAYCLLLEDLGHLPRGDQVAGATIEQAEAAIDAAAAIHARWWDHSELSPDGGLGWVPPIDSDMNLGLQAMIEATLPAAADEYGHLLGDSLARIEEWLPTCSDTLVAMGHTSRTLCHSDYRLDNMFFDGSELVLIDWQMVIRGDGVQDVAPFIGQNLSVELRETEGDRLLRRYHERVNEAGGGWADFDDFMTSFRVALNFYVAAAAFTAVSKGDTSARGERLFELFIERSVAAANYYDSWELTGYTGFNPS